MQKYQIELQQILQRAVEASVISQKQAEYLTVTELKITTLYMLTKVHKSIPTPPQRPIVSGNVSMYEMVYKFIDFHLHPIVETLPSFLKDTENILWKTEGIQLEADMLL